MKLKPAAVEEEKRTKRKRRNGERKACGSSRRVRRRVHAASTPIQRLFLACKAVFKGPGTIPAPLGVCAIQSLLDKMSPEDVGLSSEFLCLRSRRSANGTPSIKYTTVYKCDNFSLCIFFLPQKAVIPLHNHPGMTVFSKLLLGSMHIKAYDWVDSVQADDQAQSTNLRLAQLVVDSVFTAPCHSSILYPTTGGNIHTFTAITPCVVLDVLGPPYFNAVGRDCTYYKEQPYCHSPNNTVAAEDNGKKAWLEETDIPKDLFHGVEYLGPEIIDG